MKTKDCFTELAIQISTLDMKLDAILKLLSKPEIIIEAPEITVHVEEGFNLQGAIDLIKGHVKEFNDKPLQWPNESHTDYWKRIGQYYEASNNRDAFAGSLDSDDEKFLEEFK